MTAVISEDRLFANRITFRVAPETSDETVHTRLFQRLQTAYRERERDRETAKRRRLDPLALSRDCSTGNRLRSTAESHITVRTGPYTAVQRTLGRTGTTWAIARRQ